MDSDVYKWLEAASYALADGPDAELEGWIDEVIAIVAAAQMPDGYLDSYYQVNHPDARWTNIDHDHELYCAGHLFEAAVAHHRATGKRSLLDVGLPLGGPYRDRLWAGETRRGAGSPRDRAGAGRAVSRNGPARLPRSGPSSLSISAARG